MPYGGSGGVAKAWVGMETKAWVGMETKHRVGTKAKAWVGTKAKSRGGHGSQGTGWALRPRHRVGTALKKRPQILISIFWPHWSEYIIYSNP